MKTMIAMGAAAVALSGASALAATPVAQPSIYRGDVKAFAGDQQTLIGAVRDLEAEGAKVLDIRFDARRGAPGYQVAVQRQGKVTLMRVAERRGGLVSGEASTAPVAALNWRSRAQVTAADHAQVSLAQAIRTAELADHGAPAIAAGIAESASNPTARVRAYNVILAGDQPRRVAVDADTGLVIANPDALRRVG